MRDIGSTVVQGYLVKETGPAADSTTRLKKIMDAKYEKVGIPEIVQSSIHLKKTKKLN